MNYMMLLPTYRTRYRHLMRLLMELQESGIYSNRSIFLNVGCGEGDFDKAILKYFSAGYGCDINQNDIQYCHQSAANLDLHYQVVDAQRLSYRSESFDVIVCLDVVEHVADPEALIMETHRVLKPEGYAIFSFPRLSFPILYDPMNTILNLFGTKIPIGAYGYGHEKLVNEENFNFLAIQTGYQILSEEKISGELVGLTECYWAGFLQKFIKANSRNTAKAKSNRKNLRPKGDTPALVFLTDLLINIDSLFSSWLRRSIGKIYILQKKASAGIGVSVHRSDFSSKGSDIRISSTSGQW